MRTLVVAVNFDNRAEIGGFLDRLAACHPREDTVVVDDGSTDGSGTIASGRGFRVLQHERNLGVGAAIRTGIRHARSERTWDAVAIVSCNGKMNPSDLPAMIAALDGADYVQGNRFLAGNATWIPWDRWVGITFFSLIGSALLGRMFRDLTCGFRCYRLSLFDDPRLDLEQDWLNRYEMEYFIHFWASRMGARIAQVPVSIDYSHLPRRRYTKIVPFLGWWSMFRPLFRLRWRERRPARQRLRAAMPLLGLLLLAAAVRAPGLFWGADLSSGAMRFRHPDELSLAQLATDMRREGPPSRFPYTRTFALASAGVASLGGAPPERALDSPDPILAGRAVSFLFGLLTIGLLYGAVKRGTRDPRTAAFSAAFLALSPIHVMNSHLGTADAMATFFDAATVALAVGAVISRRFSLAVATAAVAGAAMAAKLTPFALIPAAIAALSVRTATRRNERLVWVALVAVGLGAFLAANGFRFNVDLLSGMANNIRGDNMFVKDHVKLVNPPFFLWLLAVGSAAPCAALAAYAVLRWRSLGLPPSFAGAFRLVALPTAAVFLLVISTLSIPYARHVLPLAPMACVLAGIALSRLTRGGRFVAISVVFAYQLTAVIAMEGPFVRDPVSASESWLARAARGREVARLGLGSDVAEALKTADLVYVNEQWSHRFERSQINPLSRPDCDSKLFHASSGQCRAYRDLVDGPGFAEVMTFDSPAVVPEQLLYRRFWDGYPVYAGAVRIYKRIGA